MAQKVLKAKTPTKAHYASGRGLAERVALVEKGLKRADSTPFNVGDTVRVHVRIKEGEKERIQAFEGTVIRIGNHGAGKSYTVRKLSHGVGVERIFLMTTPKVAKVEVLQQGKVRRAKLYYLRALVGKSARVEQDIQTNEAQAASAAAKAKSAN